MIHFKSARLGDLLRSFELIAIPVFFLISGYFSYSPTTESLLGRCQRVIPRLALLALVLNLLYYFYLYPWQGNVIHNLKDLLLWVLLGRHSMSVLWFISDLLTGYIVLYTLCRLNLMRLLPLSLLILPLSLLLSTYIPWIGLEHWELSKMRLVYHLLPNSLPYFYIGFVLHRHKDQLMHRLSHWTTLIVLGSIVLAYFEYWYSSRIVSSPYGMENAMTIVLTIATFLWCLQHPHIGAGTLLEKIGRDYSSGIYFFHMLIVGLFWHNPEWSGRIGWGFASWGSVAVYLGTIGITILVQGLQKGFGFRLF